ncbi:MAG: ferritin-like domain-containing protein [Elusimicrobiota bacterium]|jgi:bacterioferritin
MKKDQVIAALNKARSMELHAISQYMNQHYNLDNMDYGDLALKLKLVAIDEMRHAELFAERIKELDGEPTADLAAAVVKAQKVEAVFPFDAGIEDDTIAVYNGLVQVCRENGDSISMKLFETIVAEEQAHFNYFDNVGTHIKNLGATYLSKIAGTPADTGTPARGFIASQGQNPAAA